MTHVKAVRSLSVVALAAAALTLACGLGTQEDPTLRLTGTESEPLTSVDENGVVTYSCEDGKVLICHIPPGNPDNAHTICVGSPAVKAHVKHHEDLDRACDGDTVVDADAGTIEEPTPEADAGTGDTTDQDAGPAPDVDAGTPTCAPLGATCATATDCCSNQCSAAGVCENPIG